MALAGNHIAYVGATKASTGWPSHDTDATRVQPDELIAWQRPLTAITKLELTQVSLRKFAHHTEPGGTWHWEAHHVIHFEGGDTLTLPLFDHYRTETQKARATALFDALAKRSQ